jgi:hypothetical protein
VGRFEEEKKEVCERENEMKKRRKCSPRCSSCFWEVVEEEEEKGASEVEDGLGWMNV